jgi:TRAP-type C4-dicarboxylate transport system permease small subunit
VTAGSPLPHANPEPSARPAPRTGRGAALERAFVRLNQGLVMALMGSMALLVFVNVVTRYVFGTSLIWVEELTQYEMIWVAYLGAGLALREGRHVAVDTLQDLLPSLGRRRLRQVIAAATLAFLVVLVVLGLQIVAFTWDQETPVMNVPAGVPYLAVPIGAAALALHLLTFWRRYVERDFERPEDLGDDDGAEALA